VPAGGACGWTYDEKKVAIVFHENTDLGDGRCGNAISTKKTSVKTTTQGQVLVMDKRITIKYTPVHMVNIPSNQVEKIGK